MGDVVIQAEALSKRYRIAERSEPYSTIREALIRAVRSRGRGADAGAHVWALRDVDLEVREGEVVGIVGSNGAGKTTLLKLVTKITEPTSGAVRRRGRVGALLEVGTGFHPELTGRENVYLNGAILGMTRAEIDRKFDEIVWFADVERFIDTPVKRYSTGMGTRLAFAVAAHVEPEILVVDEVLAVGDIEFQRKCLGKMGEVARTGRTVLFVSHNTAAIETLCERVCWIDHGRVVADGEPTGVIGQYVRSVVRPETRRTWSDPAEAPGNDWVRLRSAAVHAADRHDSERITVRTPFVLEFEYDNLQDGVALNLSLHLYTATDVLVLNAVPVNERSWFGRPFPAGRFRDRCVIPGDLLNDGSYRVELLVVKDKRTVLYRDSAILEFDVHDVPRPDGEFDGRWAGIVRPSLDWTTDHLAHVHE